MGRSSNSKFLAATAFMAMAASARAQCTTIYAGCSGTFTDSGTGNNVGGTINVIDDCTLDITEWSYDAGDGPAAGIFIGTPESEDSTTFDFEEAQPALDPTFVVPEGDGDGEFTLTFADGVHVSMRRSQLAVGVEGTDFGNAVITCPPELAASMAAKAAICSTEFAGCTGNFIDQGLGHNVGGMLEVIDECNFKVTEWSYDAAGAPLAVLYISGEAPAEGATTFEPDGDAQKAAAADFVLPEGDGTGEFTVTVGDGVRISDRRSQISVWSEETSTDFGNAVITCPPGTGPAEEPEPGPPRPPGPPGPPGPGGPPEDTPPP